MSRTQPFRLDRQPTDQYVILENLACLGMRFFTSLSDQTDDEIVRLHDGTLAYRIIGYAGSTADAQLQLYGRVFS